MDLAASTTGAGVSGSFYDADFGTALQVGVTAETGKWDNTVSSTTVSLALTGGTSDSTFDVEATCFPVAVHQVTRLQAKLGKYTGLVLSNYNLTLGTFQYSNNENKMYTLQCTNATQNVIVSYLNGTASDTDTLTLRNRDTGVDKTYTGKHTQEAISVSASEILVHWTSNEAGTEYGYQIAYTCSGAAQVSLTLVAGLVAVVLALLF
jgi:hypothetical protein